MVLGGEGKLITVPLNLVAFKFLILVPSGSSQYIRVEGIKCGSLPMKMLVILNLKEVLYCPRENS